MRKAAPTFVFCVLLSISIGRAAADTGTESLSNKPSPTLNAPAPKGAVVLFDGKNLDQWASQKERHWETSDGPADWKLEVVPGAGSVIAKKKFGDCQLHIEFRLTKQGTNGGIFLMSRYELAIRDSSTDSKTDCGIFENLKLPVYPDVRASLPRTKWQTFDVTFRAPRLNSDGKVVRKARATVLLNGIKTHDDVELGDRKGAAKRLGEATAGPLMLQEHADPYQFRNIWIIELRDGEETLQRSAASGRNPAQQ
jgi:3-keto-disaccharide hydrolase